MLVEFGLENVHYAIATYDPVLKTTSYGTPVALPGGVSISLDPAGQANPFYADNTVYFNVVSNQGYTGTLVVALATDTFLTDVFGLRVDTNGALIENSAIKPKQIALGFQFEQDDTGRKTWLYWVTVNRPQKEATTIEDNIEVNTYSMAYEARPRLDDKDTMAYMRLDPTLTTGNQAAYDAFFDAVYVEVPIV